MNKNIKNIYPSLLETISSLSFEDITELRISEIQNLQIFIQKRISLGQEVNLNFICTHNSRRSQYSQLWAQTAASYYNIPINCFSGGVEVTALNERAVASVKRSGFLVSHEGEINPRYSVSFKYDSDPIIMFSKLYDDKVNPSSDFAAVMTCSHADENCPMIAGADQRIPLLYDDPKEFDDTADEEAKYDERSRQIATEMFYIFSKIDTRSD